MSGRIDVNKMSGRIDVNELLLQPHKSSRSRQSGKKSYAPREKPMELSNKINFIEEPIVDEIVNISGNQLEIEKTTAIKLISAAEKTDKTINGETMQANGMCDGEMQEIVVNNYMKKEIIFDCISTSEPFSVLYIRPIDIYD